MSMLATIGRRSSRWARRRVPSPFALAILLTAVAVLIGAAYSGGIVQVAHAWVHGSGTNRGIWALLAFSMQMCLILVNGYALAESPPVAAVVERLARVPTSTRSAVALVSLVAMITALINWGLGLLVGALLARAVGEQAREHGHAVHYPLVAAAGYTGLLVWHGGLSGSAPLKATTSTQLADVLGADLAARVGAMPLDTTIGSTANLAALLLCMGGVPLLLAAMAPPRDACRAAPEFPAPELQPQRRTAEDHWLTAAVPVSLGVLALYEWVVEQGISTLDPNVVNLAMLTLGFAFHGSVRSYAEAATRAVPATSGIMLQYPFYAGIMGIMAGTGIVAELAELLSGLGPTALTAATFYLAGLVNLFVPSGGGQWAVQGPIVMEAAVQAGADPSRVLLALAHGDAWTNMVQPFWALPLLGICKIEAGDILGYTLVLMLAAQVFFLVPLLVL